MTIPDEAWIAIASGAGALLSELARRVGRNARGRRRDRRARRALQQTQCRDVLAALTRDLFAASALLIRYHNTGTNPHTAPVAKVSVIAEHVAQAGLPAVAAEYQGRIVDQPYRALMANLANVGLDIVLRSAGDGQLSDIYRQRRIPASLLLHVGTAEADGAMLLVAVHYNTAQVAHLATADRRNAARRALSELRALLPVRDESVERQLSAINEAGALALPLPPATDVHNRRP